MSILPHPTYNWPLIIPIYIFRWLKGKDKNEDNWLALKVLKRFKIKLVHESYQNICSNSLNVQRSSRNVKFDAYRETNIHLLTFNVIKLVLFWHKLYYWIQFFIFWKCMLTKISGPLFMVTLNGCFLLFFYHNQTHRTTKAQSTRSQKQVLQIPLLHLCFLWNKFLIQLFWNRLLKNGRSIQSKTQNSLTLSCIYQTPTILQNMFFSIFVALVCSY